MKKENFNLDKSLNDTFNNLEDVKIYTPDLQYFSSLVKEEKDKVAKKNNIQFCIFIVCSIFILGTLAILYINSKTAYMMIQVLSLILPIAIYILMKVFRTKENLR